MTYYILEPDGSIRETEDIMEWEKWRETEGANRLYRDELDPELLVSTVFLGIDHGFGNTSQPVLYETMILGDLWSRYHRDKYQQRYSTKEDALKGHRDAVFLARKALLEKKPVPKTYTLGPRRLRVRKRNV